VAICFPPNSVISTAIDGFNMHHKLAAHSTSSGSFSHFKALIQVDTQAVGGTVISSQENYWDATVELCPSCGEPAFFASLIFVICLARLKLMPLARPISPDGWTLSPRLTETPELTGCGAKPAPESISSDKE
jgi:hypothetical protein